jgi:hypothetical protein
VDAASGALVVEALVIEALVIEALVVEALFTALFAAALSFEPSAATGAFDSCGEQAESAQIVAIANEHAATERRESGEFAVMVFTLGKVSNRQTPHHQRVIKAPQRMTKFRVGEC